MPDLMVVVDQKNWREEERDRGAKLELGDTLDWGGYKSKHPLIAQYHERGDRFFLVTARGERLWLAAIYEDVYLHHKHDGLYHWRAKTVMPMPIIDITSVRNKLRFHTGNGLTTEPGRLGNSLQTPRMLTDGDIDLLAAVIKKHGTKIARTRRASIDVEAEEGESFVREVTFYRRNPALVLACLSRDDNTCRCCGFTVDKKRFPELAAEIRARIVQAHHIRLVSAGKRKNAVSDLLTLCPTCHAVAHAIASTKKSKMVGLKLLLKSYRP